MLKRQGIRGDTLIEVLFAITIFSLVVVATLSLMNQGSSAARRSVEMSLVREQIDGQAETLRFLHESYVASYKSGVTYAASDTSPAAQYYRIIDRVKATNRQNATPFGDIATCPASTPSGGFMVNPRTATLVTTAANMVPASSGYAQLTFSNNNATVTSKGIWIEGVRTAQETSTTSLTRNAGYIDYYIRACWAAPGLEKPLTMGTIVRLYEPRG